MFVLSDLVVMAKVQVHAVESLPVNLPFSLIKGGSKMSFKEGGA